MSTPPAPLVSIVIPAWNQWRFTERCLASLREHTALVPHELIVVDNGSTDQTARLLPEEPGIRLLRNQENLGFARASNQGARIARGRYVLFLNNDTEALPGWLPALVRPCEESAEVGIVGCKLLYPDGTIQHGGVGVAYARPLPITPFHLDHRRPAAEGGPRRDLPAVTGACLLIRRDLCEELGGFDESFVNGYEDVDLCLRARELAYRVVYTPEATLIHHESVTPGRFEKARHNERLLHQRWLGRFHAFTEDRRERAPRPPRPGRPKVSVVVPTLDSFGSLAVCTEDLLLGLGPADELIFADGGSSDLTRRLARQLCSEHPDRLRLVEEETAPAALRAALARASSPLGLLVPPLASTPPELLDVVTSELEQRPGQLLAVQAGAAGLVSFGPLPLLRDRAVTAPAELLPAGFASPRSPPRPAHSPAPLSPTPPPSALPGSGPRTAAERRPRFSVLVPCYNQAHFLDDALGSLARQTFSDWEALVIDDGSTDPTSEVARRWSARDPRIRPLQKRNGGVASALNLGIGEARGDYLCWLSADDLFLPEKLASHAELFAREPQLKVTHTNFELLVERKALQVPSGMNVALHIPPDHLQVLRFLEVNYVSGITVAIHREVFETVGRFDERYRYGQDYDLWLRIATLYRSRFIDRATAVTRVHAGQGSVTFSEAGIFDSGRAAVELLNRLPFPGLFPCLDLGKPEEALAAVGTALELCLSRNSYLARCGFIPVLVSRICEWLARAPEGLRTLVQRQLGPELLPSKDPVVEALLAPLRPLLAVGAGGFAFQPFDARALLREQLLRLVERDDEREERALRRYLALIDTPGGGLDRSGEGAA